MTAGVTAATLLARADALLLDFDGPLAALMPPPVNARAADISRAALEEARLPGDIAATTDHLAVLRYVLEHRPELVDQVEGACTDAEVEAAGHCSPSLQADVLFAYAHRRALPTAIVSNNSEQAVRVFLDRHHWTRHVDAYACRDSANAAEMKPSPFLLQAALRELGVAPGAALFIGDTVSDVQAARAAGVPIVALGKDSHREAELEHAGATTTASLNDPDVFLV